MNVTKQTVHPGRPRRFDPEAGVAVAARLFHLRGYDNVSLCDLTAALGIKPPSLYAAYGSKAGLFGKALEHYAATEGAFAGPILAEPGNPSTVLDALFRAAAETYAAGDGPAGCLVMDGARNCGDPDVVALCDTRKAALRRAIAGALAGVSTQRADDLAGYAMMVLAGLSAMAREGADAQRLSAWATTAAAGVTA